MPKYASTDTEKNTSMSTQSQCFPSFFFFFLLFCSYFKKQYDNKKVVPSCVIIIWYSRTHAQVHCPLPSHCLHTMCNHSQAYLPLIILSCWHCPLYNFYPSWKTNSTWQWLWHFSVCKNHFRNLLKIWAQSKRFWFGIGLRISFSLF